MNDSCCNKQSSNDDQSKKTDLAGQLKALGHPVRLEIIARLTAMENPCCGDVCDCLTLAQSTVSQHLEILRKAGLIISRPAGNRSCFSLDHNALAKVSTALAAIGGKPS